MGNFLVIIQCFQILEVLDSFQLSLSETFRIEEDCSKNYMEHFQRYMDS